MSAADADDDDVAAMRRMFPLPPYAQQEAIVRYMLDVACRAQTSRMRVGVVESPTGTGKSLALAAGALLAVERGFAGERHTVADADPGAARAPAALPAAPAASSSSASAAVVQTACAEEPAWVLEQSAALVAQSASARVEQRQKRVRRRRRRAEQLLAALDGRADAETLIAMDVERTFSDRAADVSDSDDDEDGGDDAGESSDSSSSSSSSSGSSSSSSSGSRRAASSAPAHRVRRRRVDSRESTVAPHVVYCSRTHTQITQFLREVQRLRGAPAACVQLAGRDRLCANEAVRACSNAAWMNTLCQELRDKRSKSKRSGCEYYSARSIAQLADAATTRFHDIEELALSGARTLTCPYFAARKAARHATVVGVPYTSVFHAPTRRSLRVRLRNAIVVVDEAHNLVDAIAQAHSAFVNGEQLLRAERTVRAYLERYGQRMSARSRQPLQHVQALLARLASFVVGGSASAAANGTARATASGSSQVSVWRMNDLLSSCGVDHINPFALRAFLIDSQLDKRLSAYSLVLARAAGTVGSDSALFFPILSMLESLLAQNDAGRLILTRADTPAKSSVRFVLLDVAQAFRSVARHARAVILAGGTLSPMAALRLRLRLADSIEATMCSCAHVIRPENVCAVVLSSGPSGQAFRFTHENHASVAMLTELGRALANIVRVVRGGTVVFLPSYTVLEHFLRCHPALSEQLHCAVFREERGAAGAGAGAGGSSSGGGGQGTSEAAVRDYVACVKDRGETAVLLAVVGGKVSEGINFADELARCVVVVGLPYANRTAPELDEMLRYVAARAGVPGAADQVYESLCLNAVNQCVGRGFRHRDDYACCVLVDERYNAAHVRRGLAGWVRERLPPASPAAPFGPVFGAIARFAKAHSGL